jgi:hypothetical protein
MAVVKEFLDFNSLSWDVVETVCTDGAPAMLVKISGL